MSWPRCGRTGASRPTIGASRALPMPAASTILRTDLRASRAEAEFTGGLRDLVDPPFGKVLHAQLAHACVQRAQELQRVAVAVEPAVARARDLGADFGQEALHRGVIEDLAVWAARPVARRVVSANRRGGRAPPPTARGGSRRACGRPRRSPSAPGACRRRRSTRPSAASTRCTPACRGPCPAPRRARSCRVRRGTRRRPRRGPRLFAPWSQDPRRAPTRPARRRPRPPRTRSKVPVAHSKPITPEFFFCCVGGF